MRAGSFVHKIKAILRKASMKLYIQRDANPVPQGFRLFVLPATPRPTGTLRTDFYSVSMNFCGSGLPQKRTFND